MFVSFCSVYQRGTTSEGWKQRRRLRFNFHGRPDQWNAGTPEKGGLYVIDDLNPQPGWAADHLPKVEHLLSVLESREDLYITKLNWSVGLLVAVRR